MKASWIVAATVVLAAAVPIAAQKAKAATEVRLAVSIADRGPAEYRIESDGAGEYVDGQNGIAARLDQYGNLIINFSTPRKGSGRLVSFDYSCPFDPETQEGTCATPPVDPPSGLHRESYVSTVCPSEAPCAKIQDIDPGTQQCVQLNWQFVDGQGRSWRNGFHRNRDLPDQEGTAYGVVTRVDADTWMVEPSAAACQTGTAGVARTFEVATVKGNWVYADYGTFLLPFKLTLTRLQ